METAQQRKRIQGMPVQFKSLSVAITGELISEESRTISGYAAVFNNVDEARDMIIKGAFSKSINERGPQSNTNRKVAFLWMHNMSEPLGRITSLTEDEKGLYFEAVLDKIPQADRALDQMKSGTLNQFSIGYKYVWDKMEYDEEKDCFVCKELNLFEVSVVTLGCNELTGFSGLKSQQLESEANQLDRDTERALKSLNEEQQYEIRQIISKHIALANAEPQKEALQAPDKPQPKKGINFSNLTIN